MGSQGYCSTDMSMGMYIYELMTVEYESLCQRQAAYCDVNFLKR